MHPFSGCNMHGKHPHRLHERGAPLSCFFRAETSMNLKDKRFGEGGGAQMQQNTVHRGCGTHLQRPHEKGSWWWLTRRELTSSSCSLLRGGFGMMFPHSYMSGEAWGAVQHATPSDPPDVKKGDRTRATHPLGEAPGRHMSSVLSLSTHGTTQNEHSHHVAKRGGHCAAHRGQGWEGRESGAWDVHFFLLGPLDGSQSKSLASLKMFFEQKQKKRAMFLEFVNNAVCANEAIRPNGFGSALFIPGRSAWRLAFPAFRSSRIENMRAQRGIRSGLYHVE